MNLASPTTSIAGSILNEYVNRKRATRNKASKFFDHDGVLHYRMHVHKYFRKKKAAIAADYSDSLAVTFL